MPVVNHFKRQPFGFPAILPLPMKSSTRRDLTRFELRDFARGAADSCIVASRLRCNRSFKKFFERQQVHFYGQYFAGSVNARDEPTFPRVAKTVISPGSPTLQTASFRFCNGRGIAVESQILLAGATQRTPADPA